MQIVAKDITVGPRYYICAPARWVAKVQLLQLCHISNYWDRSMSEKWAQNENHTYEFTEFSLVITLVYLAIK